MSSPVASSPTTTDAADVRLSPSSGTELLWYVIGKLRAGATHDRVLAGLLISAVAVVSVAGYLGVVPTVFGSRQQAAAANRQATAANRQAAATRRQTCAYEANSVSSIYSTNGHRLSLAQAGELAHWEERGCPSPGPGF